MKKISKIVFKPEIILKDRRNSWNLFSVFLICFIEFVLILKCSRVVFESNDDAAMNIIASGSLTGEPSEFIIFSNILVGYLLKLLYLKISGVNWYSWYLIGSIFVGYFSIQALLINFRLGNMQKLIIHISMLLILVSSIEKLQFTRAAAIVLLAGFMIVFLYKQTLYKPIFNIIGVLLIVLGSLIRIDVFYMYTILAIPFIIIILKNSGYKRLFKFGIAVFIVLLTNLYNSYIYNNNEEYKEYKEINYYRANITVVDYPFFKYNFVKPILDSVGWTYEDYDLATNFNYDIGINKFSKESIKSIVERTRKLPISMSSKSTIAVGVEIFLEYCLVALNQEYGYLLVVLFLFCLIQQSYGKLIILLGYSFYILLVAWSMSIFGNANVSKLRIIWSLSLPIYFFIIIAPFIREISPLEFGRLYNKKLSNAMMLIVWSTMLFCLIRISRNIESNISKTTNFYAISKYIESQSNGLYVSWCGNEPDNAFDMPNDYRNAYFLGWYAGSPLNKKKIRDFTNQANGGIYSIFNRKINWYFCNNYTYKIEKYHQKMLAFYKSNYSNCIITADTIPFTKQDTIYRYSIFVPKPEDNKLIY